MSKNKGDRIQAWGDVLAELSESNENIQQQHKHDLKQAKDKITVFYEQLETKARNFQPLALNSKLQLNLKSKRTLSHTILTHTFKLTKENNYQDLVLLGFKTNSFKLKPLYLLATLFFRFSLNLAIQYITAFLSTLCFLYFNQVTAFYFGLIWKWLLLYISTLIALFGVSLLILHLLDFVTGYAIETLFSWFEEETGRHRSEEILIENHRHIKLYELRMLFMELESFKLKPILVITKKYNHTVIFELEIETTPEFIKLLE